jgi:hypothetical protein
LCRLLASERKNRAPAVNTQAGIPASPERTEVAGWQIERFHLIGTRPSVAGRRKHDRNGRWGSLQPFARKIQGPSFFAANLSEALRPFEEAQARREAHRCRLHANRSSLAVEFRSLAAISGLHGNVDYAARFLKELGAREGSSTPAAAGSHAGPANDPKKKQYVCRVIINLAARGFGAWTANALAFRIEPVP